MQILTWSAAFYYAGCRFVFPSWGKVEENFCELSSGSKVNLRMFFFLVWQSNTIEFRHKKLYLECWAIWLISLNVKDISGEFFHWIFRSVFTGNTRKWICIESTTAAKAKAHDTTTTTGSHTDSIALALLCCRWTLSLRSDVENPSSAVAKPTTIVSCHLNLLFCFLIRFSLNG